LPGQPIFSYKDCNKWKVDWKDNTCIGGGEGSIVIGNDGYKYMLIEAADIALNCDTTPGV